jgi:hypothetical protein
MAFARVRAPPPAAVLLALLAACGATSAPRAPVAELSLAPDSARLFIGESLQLVAKPKDASGNVLSDRQVTWQSSNPSVAGASGSGLVTGVAHGHATITASTEGKTATAEIGVSFGGLVGFAGGTLALPNGLAQLQFPTGALAAQTRVYFDSATALPTTPAPALAGTGFTLGPADLVLHQTATLTIRYAAGLVPPAVEPSTGMYSSGGDSWVAVDGSVLDQPARAVTAPVWGPATYGLLAPGPVATITVSPASMYIVLGTTGAFTAELRDSTGTLLQNRPVAWKTSDTTVARVSPYGVASGLGLGSVFLTASSGGASGRALVIIAVICVCPSAASAPAPAPAAGGAATACACSAGAP